MEELLVARSAAELILHADAVKQVRPWTRGMSIQRVRTNFKTAKELGSVLQFVSHVSKETTKRASGKYFCQIIWQASVTTLDAIGCGICRDKLNHIAVVFSLLAR